MKLFDNSKREYKGPSLYAESQYNYLNRSARDEVEEIRNLLEEWFIKYDGKEKSDLRSRFISKDDIQHESAFFELFMHELLLKMNCSIEKHPAMNNNKNHPDFLVKSGGENKFYVEVVVATNESKEEAKARIRENAVYDCINQLKSPDYFIGMNIHGQSKTPIPGKKIVKYLMNNLAEISSLDKKDIESIRWTFEHNGWSIEFYPISKNKKSNENGIRPIAIKSYDFKAIRNEDNIRNALVKKAKKYGDFDIPYVIVINVLGEFVEEDTVSDVLFGEEALEIKETLLGMQKRMIRKPNGVWRDQKGIRYKRLSAVLVFYKLKPWDIAKTKVCLYHNPWAKNKYNSVLKFFPQYQAVNNRYIRIKGENLATLFGLSKEWPYNAEI